MIYLVDWALWVLTLTPPLLRQALQRAWLQVLIAPVADLHAAFLAYRTATNTQLSYTGQVILLERLLNLRYYNAFDPNPITPFKPIYIIDVPTQVQLVPLYLKSEAVPQTVYLQTENIPWVLFTRAETLLNYDFKIMVPASLTFDQTELRRLVDRYKYAGTQYIVELY